MRRDNEETHQIRSHRTAARAVRVDVGARAAGRQDRAVEAADLVRLIPFNQPILSSQAPHHADGAED